MALAEIPTLPDLDVMLEHSTTAALGDLMMFASISPEQRHNPDHADLQAEFGAYVDAGILAVQSFQDTVPHLRSVK